MDQIGPYTFIRISRPPDRVGPQWALAARSGVPGVAIWDTGTRGVPFQVRSMAVALNFVVGRTFFPSYKTLELAGPVSVRYGTVEAQQVYKVLHVEQGENDVQACPRIAVANDSTWYTAIVMATWTLLPLDPFVQRP